MEEATLVTKRDAARQTAFGCPRDFLNNRFVYLVISARARGLSIGVNMNPDKHCNFDCLYCEVNRAAVGGAQQELDSKAMAEELKETLKLVRSNELSKRPPYATLPPELLQLRHVSLSGDGEPTLCPRFADAVETVVHVRALGRNPFFKIVLITNASGLDLPEVQRGLQYFTPRDEIWAKLDAGTQAYMDRANRPQVPLEKVLENILKLGRERPVVIQSLFPSIHGEGPTPEEVDRYAERLLDLSRAGAQISLVQIYSATRPVFHPECSHLPLKALSNIAQHVRKRTGLNVEVY